MAFLAKEIYSGDGVNQNFNVPFGYISKDHVIVAVDGVETTAFTFTSDTIIQITTPPPSGTDNVAVFRRTARLSRITDYADATSLTEGELDNDSLQAFYILQEFLDEASIQLTQDSTGVWDALNKTITNLADPVNAQDAATKNWVESNARFGADQIADGSVSDIEYQHLGGVTNNIQTQINSVSGVGSPTASVTQASSLIYGTTGGSADTYTLTLSPAPTTNPKLILAKFHVTNTGASTINVNSLGVVTITKQDGSALSAGDIPLNSMGILVYDGTNYQIVPSFTADEQVEVNRSNIERAFEEIQENHGGALLMEAGWSDSFGNANEQGADEANSTSFLHDNTNKLYKGTDPTTNQNSDKDYSTESNYIQQEWTNSLLSTGQATVTNGDATVTLVSGSWPTNCAKSRISFDSGSTWYDIDTRTDATNIELSVVATESTANYDYIIRMSQFSSGVVELNGTGSTAINEQDTTTITTAANVKGNSTNNLYHATQFKTTSADPITRIALQLKLQNSPTDSVSVEIYSSTTPTASLGNPNASLATSSNTIPYSDLNSSTYTEVTFNINYTPTLNNYYFIVVKRVADDTSNYYLWGGVTSGSSYAHAYGLTYQSSAWNGTSQTEGNFKITQSTGSNLISEYVSICDTEAQKTDTSHWTDINSGSVTETLNSQNAFYSIAFDPVSLLGANTEVKIFNQTDSVWRVIAKNNSGTWEYNNDSGNSAAYTGVSATVNDMLHAVSQAISTQSGNRMTGAELAAITDGEWEAANGWSTSVDSIVRLATLYSNSSSQNPSVSQYRLDYDSSRAAMDLRSKTYDPGFVPAEGYLWCRAEHSNSDGAGTFYVSRDGGVSWSIIPMTQQGQPLTGNEKILRGTVDVSGQPSGQDIRCRYVTTVAKDQFLHSWGLQCKQ